MDDDYKPIQQDPAVNSQPETLTELLPHETTQLPALDRPTQLSHSQLSHGQLSPAELLPHQLIPQATEEASITYSSSTDIKSFSPSKGLDLTDYQGVTDAAFGDHLAGNVSKTDGGFVPAYQLANPWNEDHREYKCKRCGRAFAKKHNLLRHNCVNACNVCGQQFTRSYNLKLHMQLHGDGSKLFKCEYCGKGFTRRYTLLTHTRSHTGIKLFKCSVCSKAFTRQHTLNLHMKRHGGKANLFCRQCFAVFTDTAALQLHRKTTHPKSTKQSSSRTVTTTTTASNVVFPNNSSHGFMYGIETTDPTADYSSVGSYYQQTQQEHSNSPFQSVYPVNISTSGSSQTKGCNDVEPHSMQPMTAHPVHMDKSHWFEDEVALVKDPACSQADTFSSTAVDNNVATNDIVTIIDDNEDEDDTATIKENSLDDVNLQDMAGEMKSFPKESQEADAMASNEPEKHSHRSLFPINGRRNRRMMRNFPHHSLRNIAYKYGSRMVKETSKICIDVSHPKSQEDSCTNPLMTPPRSSETSSATPRSTRASSESASPGAASLRMESPSPCSSQQNNMRLLQTKAPLSDGKGSVAGTVLPDSQPDFLCTEHQVAPQNAPMPYPTADDKPKSSDTPDRKQSLQSPQQHELSQEMSSWRCPHCAITFEESLMFVVHMGCHGQQDPYQCSMCGLVSQDCMAFTLHIIGGKHARHEKQF